MRCRLPTTDYVLSLLRCPKMHLNIKVIGGVSSHRLSLPFLYNAPSNSNRRGLLIVGAGE